jgi:hypothetical protein
MTRPSTTDRTAVKRTAVKRTAGKTSTTRRNQHGVQGGTSEGNRIAIAILEVLAGGRSPAEAAEVLKISLPRYYILETRALEGLVAACEPKPLGKQPSLETRIAVLEKELRQAGRDCARQEALVRVAQRSVGLRIPELPKGKAVPQRDRRGRKKRRPAVRALKAADKLRSHIASDEPCGVQPCVPSEPGSGPGTVNVQEEQGTASC